jgi:hypothetical protein
MNDPDELTLSVLVENLRGLKHYFLDGQQFERAFICEQAARAVERQPSPLESWFCEIHPELPWPHDDCPGPGVPLTSQVDQLVHQRQKLVQKVRETEMYFAGLLVSARDQIDEWAAKLAASANRNQELALKLAAVQKDRDDLLAGTEKALELYRAKADESFLGHGHNKLIANDPECGPWANAMQVSVDRVRR